MNYEYFKQWVDMTRNMQRPFQALTELNVKALRGLSYITPEELAKIKLPEELVEKHVHITIENSHKVLDYMQKSFEIIENTLSTITPTNFPKNLMEELRNKGMTNPLFNPAEAEKTRQSLSELAKSIKKPSARKPRATKKSGQKIAAAQKSITAKQVKKKTRKIKQK